MFNRSVGAETIPMIGRTLESLMRFSVFVLALLLSAPVAAQSTTDPFPTPIPATDGVISVSFRQFAVALALLSFPLGRRHALLKVPNCIGLWFLRDPTGPEGEPLRVFDSPPGSERKPSRCLKSLCAVEQVLQALHRRAYRF